MAKYNEIIYMILDEVKATSDDRFFEEEHIIFLMHQYRSMLLKQRYSDLRRAIPTENYQLICVNVTPNLTSKELACNTTPQLISTDKIPSIVKLTSLDSSIRVTGEDYWTGMFTYVNNDRYNYVGNSKYLTNVIYATIDPNNYLNLRSTNSNFIFLDKVKIRAVFENPEEAYLLSCDGESFCDIREESFPLEQALVPIMIQAIVKELLGSVYKPEDLNNNAKDEASDVTTK